MSELPIDTRRATRTFVSTLARGVAATLFVVAAVEKVGDLSAFAASIRAYGVFPPLTTNVLAFVTPWVELFAAALLMFGTWRREARLVIGFLLVMFIALKISVMVRGIELSCGCVSEDSFLAPLLTGVWGIVTNLVLIACLTLDAYLTPRVANPATRAEPATT